MDLERRYDHCTTFTVEYFDENGRSVGLPEKVQPYPGRKLRDCLDHRLRQRGFIPANVLFFVENSKTPLPENCDANFLSGQRIVARVRNGMARFGRSRTQHSVEIDISDVKTPIRKCSDDSLSSWRSSLGASKMLSRSRGNNSGLSHSGSSCQDFETKTRKNSASSQPTLLNIPLDEPSCSEEQALVIDETGTRRIRNTTVSRRSLFFGKEKAEMLPRLNVLKDEVEQSVPMFDIENHWKEIVKNTEKLTKREYEQQEAIWEFVTTEQSYLQLLKQMSELCQCFVKLQEYGYMREIDPRRVFLNYPELYIHNSKFWKRAVLPMLDASRETGASIDPTLLKTGFERIDDWWPCYTSFIYGHADCHTYVQKCQKENELFREFVTWAESQDSMRRQRLLDALTNPMQRLTRYSLLLKAVLKHSTDDIQRDTIQDMIIRIEKATRNVEETLNNNDLQNKLNELLKTIESYEAVDSEEFEKLFPMKCHIRLSDPMPFFIGQPQFRRVYLRGDLKFRDGKQGPKIDTHCILFTDLFLICKASNKRCDRLRVLKPPIHIAKMCLQQFPDYSGFVISPMNDFGTPSALYYLSTPSIEETRKWLEMTNMALREFYRLKPLSPQQCLVGFPIALSNGYAGAEASVSEMYRIPSHGGFTSPDICNGFLPEIVHRKSSSMDSQTVAEHNRITSMRKADGVLSTDQIDRLIKESGRGNSLARPERSSIIPRHKLSVSNDGGRDTSSLMTSSMIGQSKSSIDLHVTSVKSTNRLDSPEPSSYRSRSNSIGPTEPNNRSQSRSPSSSHIYCKRQIYIGTPSTSLENRENCDLRNSQGPSDNSSVETSETKEYANENRSSSPSLFVNNDEVDDGSGISCGQGQYTNNARRFERRYHTSDGIDVLKPKAPTSLPPGILKRFSWNVSTAVGGSSRKISARMNEQNCRRQSQSTVTSSESFSSSTSGFSTASSYMDGSTVTEEMTPTGDMDIHISTVSIGEHTEGDDTRTLRIQFSNEDEGKGEKTPPPLPEMPPPVLHEKGQENDGTSVINNNKHQELLKFIMDNHLETSDV